MKHTKSIIRTDSKASLISFSKIFIIVGLLLLAIGIGLFLTPTNNLNFNKIAFKMIIIAVVCLLAGFFQNIYFSIKYRKTNFKCLHTDSFDDHLFKCGIYKNSVEDSIIIPLAKECSQDEFIGFYIYAPYDFSDKLLAAKDNLNSFLKRSGCEYEIVDQQLDVDRVVYFCKKNIYTDRIRKNEL